MYELDHYIEQGIIVEDPLCLAHMLTKYYYEELLDDITIYHVQIERKNGIRP